MTVWAGENCADYTTSREGGQEFSDVPRVDVRKLKFEFSIDGQKIAARTSDPLIKSPQQAVHCSTTVSRTDYVYWLI